MDYTWNNFEILKYMKLFKISIRIEMKKEFH